MKIIIAVSLFMLAGCASTPKATDEIMKAGLLDGAVKSAHAPLFKLICPATGCIIGSLEIGNPAAGAQLAEVVRVVMTPQVSASERIWLSVIDKGFSTIGMGLIANGVKSFAASMFGSQTTIATGGFNAISGTAQTGFGAIANTAQSGFGATAVIAGRIPQPGAITTTNTTTTNTTTNLTASGAGSAVASGGNASGNNPITTTTTTSTNPSPRVCTVSATGVQTCSGG